MIRVNYFLLFVFVMVSCGQKKETPTEQSSSKSEPPTIAAGDYTSEDGTATLSIDKVQPDAFTFDISVVTENANCTGEIGGRASLGGNNEWNYTDDETGCALRFSLSGDAVTVTESGDCDHGAACSFAATYKKDDDKNTVSAPPARLDDVVDFYMALDDTYFNCELNEKYSQDARSKAIVYQNVKNGYLIFKSQELDSVQLALYKNKINGKSYLAYVYQCGEGCQCNRREFLTFEDGEWKNVYDEVFPDLSSLIKEDVVVGFRLPEKGTAIVLYDYNQPGKRLGELQWNGAKFNLTVQ